MNAFVLRKLHSLSGIVPVGIFLVEHLWTNAAAFGGQEPYDRAVAEIQRAPFLAVIEIFGIFLPLAFHSLYGLWLTTKSKPNAGRYAYARNWLYVLQRISGVVIFAFVLAHLWEFRVQKWLFGMASEFFYTKLTADLSWTWGGVPLIAIGYLMGIAASLFHLANGIVGFTMAWGITASRAAQRRVGILVGVFGVGLFVLSTLTVLDLATGSIK
ncbi:MAG: succinate dehydrogenase [Polyangiaceae bacterium]|nr:succinate dehydrogenase [Polyangiaceae bacterium]